MSVPGGGVRVAAGGAAVLPMGGVIDLGWAVQVLRSGAVILMASSASSSAGGGGPGPGPAAATGGSGSSGQGRGKSANKPGSKPGKPGSMRVETGAAFAPHPAIEGIREPGPIRSFTSHEAFTRYMGPAGKDKQWHHIVAQTPGNVARFGPRAIHNTANVIRIDTKIHREINKRYSSNDGGGMTVRKRMSTQSFEKQQAFGIKVLRQLGVIP